jgi:hypothetical protein
LEALRWTTPQLASVELANIDQVFGDVVINFEETKLYAGSPIMTATTKSSGALRADSEESQYRTARTATRRSRGERTEHRRVLAAQIWLTLRKTTPQVA